MTAAWPGALPQFVLEEGFSQDLPNQTVESQIQGGKPIRRRRYTRDFRPMQASVKCTDAQLATFRTFYETTLAGGALPFTWVDPLSQEAFTFKFRQQPPVYQPIAYGSTAVVMQLIRK